jgi:phosphoribosyl 1,2-cyclic phosphodiesterase
MEVTFWGVRGAVPAPGPETNRYGGNTSCVELRTHGGNLIILDAGTGVIPLGRKLMSGTFGRGGAEATIFLSHLHWDHIQGFPFFGPLFVQGNRVTIFGPGRSSSILEGILEGQMNPQYSPLYTMRNLGASIEVRAVAGDRKEIEFEQFGVRISWYPNPHGGTDAFTYRFEEDGRSLVYAPEAGYLPSEPSAGVRSLYDRADVLIHDFSHWPEDRATRLVRGPSSIAEAVEVAIVAKVKKLVTFHYDQDDGDDVVDALIARARRLLDENGGQSIELIPAREGLTLEI